MLKGKSAIVTGGGSNIGRAIALALADEGANVAMFDIDEDAARKVIRRAKELGVMGRMVVYPTDITLPEQVEASVAQAIKEFGQIHILINSVGWDHLGLFIDQPLELHKKIVDVNYIGAIICMRAVLPHMIDYQYGRIVSVGSDAGRVGEYHEAVYSGAKAAVTGLSKGLAREVGKYNITVNVVSPGLTPPDGSETVGRDSMWQEGITEFWTPQRREKASRRYAMGRLGRAQDIANVTVFLASDRCEFVTGQVWSVSGGYTMA